MKFFLHYNNNTTEITDFVLDYDIDFSSLNIRRLQSISSKATIKFNQNGRNLQGIFLQNPILFLEIRNEANQIIFLGRLVQNYNYDWNKWKVNQDATFLDLFDVLKDIKVTLANTFNNLQDALNAWRNSLPTEIRNLFTIASVSEAGNIQVFDTNIPATEMLNKILMRFGRFGYFIGNVLNTQKIQPTGTGIAISKIANIKKTKNREQGIEISCKYSILKNLSTTFITKLTHKDTNDLINDCSIIVNGNSLVFGGDIVVEIPKEFKFVSNLLVRAQHTGTNGHYQQLTNTTTLRLENISLEENKIKIRVRNTLPTQIIITRFEIFGNAWKEESEVYVASQTPGTPKEKVELKLYGSQNQSDIQNLTDLICFILDKNRYTIQCDVLDNLNVNVGNLIAINDTTSNTSGTFIVVGKNTTKTKTTLTLLPISTYFSGQYPPTTTYQPSQNNEPLSNNETINHTIQQALQHLSSSQGTTEGGWTNIPQNFGANDVQVFVQFNVVRLVVKKQYNLSNLEGYDVEWKYTSQTTWTSVGIIPTETIVFRIPFQTDTNGNRIQTQANIRIRRRTRAGLTSNWWTTTITLNPNSSSEITIDAVTIDNNNFWMANHFKVGDVTKYILYSPSGLQIVNAGTQITNTDVRITNNQGFSSVLDDKSITIHNNNTFNNPISRLDRWFFETLDNNRGFQKSNFSIEWLEGYRVLSINRNWTINTNNTFFLPVLPSYWSGSWTANVNITLYTNFSDPIILSFTVSFDHTNQTFTISNVNAILTSLYDFTLIINNSTTYWGFDNNNMYFFSSSGYLRGVLGLLVSPIATQVTELQFAPNYSNFSDTTSNIIRFLQAQVSVLLTFNTTPSENHRLGISKFTRILNNNEIFNVINTTTNPLNIFTFNNQNYLGVKNFISHRTTQTNRSLFWIPYFLNEEFNHFIRIDTTSNIDFLDIRNRHLNYWDFSYKDFEFIGSFWYQKSNMVSISSTQGNLSVTWRQLWWDNNATPNTEILNYTVLRLLWTNQRGFINVFFFSNPNISGTILNASIRTHNFDGGLGQSLADVALSYTIFILDRLNINYTYGGNYGIIKYSFRRVR